MAIIKGADESSPMWRHVCLLAGLLIGLRGEGHGSMSRVLRGNIGSAVVMAVNSSIRNDETQDEFAANSIVMMLSHISDILSISEKANLDHQALLPLLYYAPFSSKDGLHSGYFLSTMDADIEQVARSKFDWSSKSSTFIQCHRMGTGPLISNLGPLSRLTAFSVEQVRDPDILGVMVKDLSAFTRSLDVQWRQNKLSEIDALEESDYLTEESLQKTLPLLWRTLRAAMFAIVVILRSLLGRLLEDPRLPQNRMPFMAIQTLHILRNLYFISSRASNSSFSQYRFVALAAIDILSQYPIQAEAFLEDIKPMPSGDISQHPHDRCHDLYFLNTAENIAIVLSPEVNESLLIGPAKPYLGLGSDSRLSGLFEAAHCVMLAVFSAPQNVEILPRHIHPYVDLLFKVFPEAISPRQFRMAIKTLVKVTSPPFPIAMTEPMLSSTILELIRIRLESATEAPLQNKGFGASGDSQSALSEQSACQLALIDSLPLLPTEQLEGWLPIVAEAMDFVRDPLQSQICEQRFWEILSNGEMDVDRAALCVSWWGMKGGHESVVAGDQIEQEGAFMSGALTDTSKL